METPSEKQALFMRAKEKFVIFGGARGGGKSWAVRWKAILLCVRFPGIRVLIMRKSYPELLENHIKPMQAILADIARYNGVTHEIRFPNGSVIKFMFCSRDSDLMKIQLTVRSERYGFWAEIWSWFRGASTTLLLWIEHSRSRL